jgi:hypothetical protein
MNNCTTDLNEVTEDYFGERKKNTVPTATIDRKNSAFDAPSGARTLDTLIKRHR